MGKKPKLALEIEIHARGYEVSDLEEKRIQRQLDSLGKRLAKFPGPRLELALDSQPQRRRMRVDLRVALGPHAGHLVSHQEAETADLAVKLAADDIKRQLERRLSGMRGESSYGVPSRRLPADLRPNPVNGMIASEEELDEDELEDESLDELMDERISS
jgi:ribosome-associated translation inhibitor RaiA